MRTNIKKALAILLTMVMLCGLLPLGALTVSAADNLISNGTFESGTSGWACSTGATVSTTTTDPGSGSQSLILDCTTVDYCWTYVAPAVTANTDYVLKFKGKVSNGSISVNFQNSSWAACGINSYKAGSPSTWTDFSYEFNSGNNSKLLIFFQTGWEKHAGSYIYLDDVVLIKKDDLAPEQPEAGENLLVNGDFESGTAGTQPTGWSVYDINYPSLTTTAQYHAGAKGAALAKRTVRFVLYQDVQVTANTDYTVTFYYKSTTTSSSNGAFYYYFGAYTTSSIGNITAGGGTLIDSNAGEVTLDYHNSNWTKATYTFNSGSATTIRLAFASGKDSVKETAETAFAFVDDVVLTGPEQSGSGDANYQTKLEKDWNDGVLGFNKDSVVAEGPDGSKCLKWSAVGGWSATSIKVTGMEKNTDYLVRFKMKTSAGNPLFITIQAYDNGVYKNDTVRPTTAWAEYEMIINTEECVNDAGEIYFKFQDQGAAQDVWVDDLYIAKPVEPEEPEVPAVGNNLVVNGSFENGNEGWRINSHGAIVDGGYTGKAFQMSNPTSTYEEIGYQEVSVEAHETYTLTWRSKRVSGTKAFNMEIANAPWVQNNPKPQITPITNQTWMTDTSGNWVEHKISIKMTDDNGNGISKIMIKLTSESTASGVILIDDVTLTKNLTASFDGYLYNGDFEIGNVDSWTSYNGSAASTAAKHTGSYGAHLKGNGSWGGILYQNTVNVVAGKTYVVSFWIKVVATGMNLQIKDGNQDGSVLTRGSYGVGDWKQVTLEVTPTLNSFCINFCGLGSTASAVAGKEEIAYVDDIVVTLKGGNPEEKVSYVGSSVRDSETTDGSGKGLAFQFQVATEGGSKGYDNKYQNDGKIVLGDQKYTLVRMGAVMTNNATVGQSAANFTLAAVNGTKVVNIPAVYLNGADGESLSFAVRILDIPDRHIGTSIYARPYYVYEENGAEVTVYGNIRSSNYAKAANISTADKTQPIKILSIGHSFSKDVMTTNLYNMFIEGGYTDVTIGYLYMAGCSMPKHLYNIQNNLAQYEYAKNNNGNWVTKNNISALTALKEEAWDFVTVQSSPDYIGGQAISGFKLGINNDGSQITLSSPQTEYEAMSQITDWIQANATNANVKIDYHMIWSFSQGCDLWSGMYHKDPNTNKYSQMVMYNNIVNITQDKVQNHDDINRVIPSATAIQNARSSFMGDTFNMPDASMTNPETGEPYKDGYHLNDYGDYVAALTWYCHYSGDNAQIMAGYLGNGAVLNLTMDEFNAIAEAVNNAIDIPYAVTESTHK